MHPQFVFDALPIRVKPQPQETLTSLLMRNAAANGLTSMLGLYTAFTLSSKYRNPPNKNSLLDHPPLSWGDLATVLACSREDLLATTFHNLVVRFGREPRGHPMGIFLSGCIAGALRFCPQCLTEQQKPHYRLSWRFSFLSGCATHGCRLWDVCPQCKKAMPLFSAPFTVGRCAFCQTDLCQAKTVSLSPTEQMRVQILTEDLIYLLSELSDPLPLSLCRLLVRQQLALMQRATGKSSGQTSHDRPLLGYLQGLETIGASFRMLFDEEVWCENALLQDPGYQENSEARLVGTVLAERIATKRQEMMEADLPVTRQAIEARLRIPLKHISSYPEVQRALAHIPNELSLQCKERRASRQAELIPLIPQALDQLEQEGKSLSVEELGRLLQADCDTLCQLPDVKTALAERRAQRRRQHRVDKQAEREQKLVACMEATIARMRRSGEQVTVEGICKAAAISYGTARKYPQVRTLLSPFRKDQVKREREARWQTHHQTRDAELIGKITTTARLLVTEGKPITPYAICRVMGLTSCDVKHYPRAWNKLEEYRLRQEPRGRAMPQEDQHLITQLEAAIAHFNTLGVRITHTLLCHHLRIPMADLAGRYPHARALLLKTKKRTRNRPRLQVENLYEEVVNVIQALETTHEPVTRNAICIRLQVSVYQLNRDPEVKALIADVMARRPEAQAVRHIKIESELIERLHKAYALLAINQESFSCNRLYAATGKDGHTFRRYPQARVVAEQLVAEHVQDVRRTRSAFAALLIARTNEMLLQRASAMSDLPMRRPDDVPRPTIKRAKQAQWRRDRDASLAAEVVRAIRELEQSGQEVTRSAVCMLTGWNYQTLCNAKYPQTQQLMRDVVARRAGVTQRQQVQREAELVCKVRRVYAELQQTGQPVQVKTIVKVIGLGRTTLFSYPAVKAELARIRENMMSQYQWERHCREIELLTCLDAYIQQCEKQEQPLLIRMIARKLGLPLSTILGYPRLKERIEQIRSAKRAQ